MVSSLEGIYIYIYAEWVVVGGFERTPLLCPINYNYYALAYTPGNETITYIWPHTVFL